MHTAFLAAMQTDNVRLHICVVKFISNIFGSRSSKKFMQPQSRRGNMKIMILFINHLLSMMMTAKANDNMFQFVPFLPCDDSFETHRFLQIDSLQNLLAINITSAASLLLGSELWFLVCHAT